MSRHLDNLKRLAVKLQTRFGEDDALYQQVKRELALHQADIPVEPALQDWSIPYRKYLKNTRYEMALH